MRKTVIIAVNDPHILYLLQRYAEESGLQTVSACQGIDLLALLAHQANPALLILDVEWPGTAGQKKLHGVKAEAATRNIPVVVYSCLDEPADEWNEGVAGYLPKSVMYDDFVAVLKHAGVCLEPAWPR
ncbi:MAG: response regulator [Chloroflexi bacterium]|nr:response regulator [Chloroflexota bacterium]